MSDGHDIAYAINSDLERALNLGLAQRKDVVVAPLESLLIDDVLTFRVRRELIDPSVPTPEGWVRYPTSKGIMERL